MLRFLLLKSFRKRKFVSLLTIFAIALSLALFLSVEKLRNGIEESFTNSISNADLIVGSRSGPLQLLLYTVFHLGSPTNNISIKSYSDIKSHPAVDWTIPISLGDSYRGFRVVATDINFFKHYQFHRNRKVRFFKGQYENDVFSVVLGSHVAKILEHQLGDSIVLSHGISEGSVIDHENTPFKVSGILKKTGTPVDKSVIINLSGMEALHVGWENGFPSGVPSQNSYREENLKTTQITSFILRSKNRIALLGLQRKISTYKKEALSAIIPALTLAQLWGLLDKLESSLLAISFFVIIVGFLSLLIVLYMSINDRMKEIMILRSIGVSSLDISLLLISETFLLTLSGVVLGFILNFLLILGLGPVLETQYGLYVNLTMPSFEDLFIVYIFLALGALFGVIPALRAYSSSNSCQLGFR